MGQVEPVTVGRAGRNGIDCTEALSYCSALTAMRVNHPECAFMSHPLCSCFIYQWQPVLEEQPRNLREVT